MVKTEEKDLLYSTEHACNQCGYSIDRLEPKLFSFNSPFGACSTCDGLGVENHFDESRLIVDSNMSLADGVIFGWDKRYYQQLLMSLATAEGFSMTTPWKRLSEAHQQMILHGTKHRIPITYTGIKGRTIHRSRPFEGVIPTLMRRYQETFSGYASQSKSHDE